jgi:uncharacterized protein
MELVKVRVDRVIGSPQSQFAVVVRSDEKAFLIYVGEPEAVAIFREMKGYSVQRPLPHDLVLNVFTAFGIKVRGVAISSIVQQIFCATLMLTQEIEGAADGMKRNEVRLDLRASDAMILALKQKVQLFASREVIDQVEDVTPLLAQADEMQDGGADEDAESEE